MVNVNLTLIICYSEMPLLFSSLAIDIELLILISVN